MPASARVVLAVLLAMSGSGPLGCSVSTELRRVRTPRQGVTLEYLRSKGQGFEGTLKIGNTRAIEGLTEPLSQTLTCEVSMVMLATSDMGTEVRATFTGVDLDWDLPPAATYSSDELVELAHAQLRGMQVTFVVRPDGRIQALPTPPANAPLELREVIETMLMGLESFFVPLPGQPLGRNDVWHERFEHTTANGLGQALEQDLRLDGSYEHRTDDGVVVRRLMIEQQRHEQRGGERGPVTVERDVRAEVLFADAGYPADIDRETREADPEEGVVFRKVRAKWIATRGLVPELMVPPPGDVQVIRDPCNPDYVGPLACEDEGDEPEPPEEDDEPDGASAESDDEDADADADAEPSEDDGDGDAP
ncbi:hypothetical protein [Paraliomyxa miuraensis]|uniref:hypothetical protein n=1 Tax=Paraliomyxa miuraensis TaxID=376150 RepID=UPI00224D24BB|nr:hypothetical protein [Paraliomyxa miuraensis]MCX4245612.1 hypothetical protein [Paraliomyxa miuraensis]